jgi:Putative adhesin
MTNARKHSRISTVLLVVSFLSLLAAAQEKKEFSCTVGSGAVISITNNYGPITVKPSGSSQVLVETIFHSDVVNLVNEQHGDRIELRSISSRQGTNLVEYTVLVPAAAFVTLRSSDGTLRAQGLRGDVVLEAASGSVEVTDISDAHLHVKTLSGPITLADIRGSHLDIHSVRGNVNLHNVTGPSVEVNSGGGRITYDGDPGRVGEYLLTSHSGDLEVSIPASAWVEIKTRSIKGQSDPEFPNVSSVPTMGQINLMGKPGKIGSRFDCARSAARFASNGPDGCRFQRMPAPRLPRCLTLRRIYQLPGLVL